jgi:hypothetical protein
MWLGTDPMQGNNPDVSTYSFCHNNPVIIIDIDGKKDYYISPNGYFYESTSLFEKIKSFLGLSNKSDRVFSEKNRCLLSTYPEGTITIVKNGKSETVLEIKNQSYGKDLFKQLKNFSNVEWARIVHSKGRNTNTTLVSEHMVDDVSLAATYLSIYEKKGEFVKIFEHSHPSPKGVNPATMNLDIYNGPSYYDYETAKAHPHTSFYVYDLYNDIKYYYNGTGYNKKYHKEGVDNK